jgi:hypothetical protein
MLLWDFIAMGSKSHLMGLGHCFINLTQSVMFLGWGIRPSQDLYLHLRNINTE